MYEDIPWQLMAWKRDWTRNPWAAWVARGDMRRERPDMTRALSRCDLAAVGVGGQYRDENLLHVASHCGHARMVMLLLGKGVDKDKTGLYGRTPLCIASREGHLEIVRLLIDAGADKDKADDDGVTPLFVASQNGHLEIVRLLIEAGADKDKADKYRWTPLLIASQNGHVDVARLLDEAGSISRSIPPLGSVGLQWKGERGSRSPRRPGDPPPPPPLPLKKSGSSRYLGVTKVRYNRE